jgi:outer membrane protein
MLRFTSLFFLITLGLHAFGQVRIGVISDLPRTNSIEKLVQSIIEETDRTTGVNLKVSSSDDLQFYDISSFSEVQKVYASTKADLFITIGGMATKSLSRLPSLQKPVIGIGVIDHALQEIPYVEGRSGKDNFTYLLTSRDIISEIESFKKVNDFEELTIVTDPALSKSINAIQAQALVDSLKKALNINIRTVQAGDDPLKTIEEIGIPEAVYLVSLFGKDANYVLALNNHFVEKKIPAFSSLKSHVDLGILASTSGDNSSEQVVRRVALVAADILSGENASEKLVALNLREDIFLNIATARKLSLSLPFDLLLTANLVGDYQTTVKTYSFNEIAAKALEKNLDIQVSYKNIDLSELDIRSNRALVLPELTSGLTGVQINEDRANALFNSSEQTLTLDFALTQVIYSEEALAAIRISKYLKSAQEYQTEVDVLNVILDTYGAYLNVLSAKTNLDIQRRNLDNTKTNLELARIRVAVGSANNADLYRWQSEVANATQSVIDAQAAYLTVKLQLNNLLANSLVSDYEIKDIGLEDELFTKFRQSPVTGLIRTPDDLKRAADFLIQESLAQNPNKKQLLETIKASERQLTLNKRLFYVPTIALQAQTSQVLARGGKGSENPDSGVPNFGIGLQDNSWSIAASLTFPIFTGLNRQVNRQRSLVQLEQLELSNQNLDLALDLSIRSSTINLLNTTTNLEYSRISAESATKNFKLVQNNYREGAVNITQLIDAQEAALGANLQAAIAVYDYIFANLQLEYSIGFFSMFLTEDEITDFNSRFLEFLSEN